MVKEFFEIIVLLQDGAISLCCLYFAQVKMCRFISLESSLLSWKRCFWCSMTMGLLIQISIFYIFLQWRTKPNNSHMIYSPSFRFRLSCHVLQAFRTLLFPPWDQVTHAAAFCRSSGFVCCGHDWSDQEQSHGTSDCEAAMPADKIYLLIYLVIIFINLSCRRDWQGCHDFYLVN